MDKEIETEFRNAKYWASIERENQVNAFKTRIESISNKGDKSAPLINKVADSQEEIRQNAKEIKELFQKRLKEKVKEELSKSKIILGETNENTYNKIRRIVDITELEESSICVRQASFETYEITTKDYVNVIFEGTANEVLLIIQIISGYKKEELYKKLCEKEREEREREELINKVPQYTQADFIKDLEENIDKMKAIRGKLNEVYKMMENFKDVVCLGEEQFLKYANIKSSIAYDERSLKEIENIFTIYLQEEQEELKNKGGKANEERNK